MNRPKTRGMTLIELTVGLAVLAILTAVGVPSFDGTLNSSRLSASANELSAALQLARAEAIRRNRSVVLCNSSDLRSCSADAQWSGWLVFVDSNGNGVLDAGEDIVKTGVVDAPLALRASPAITSRGQIVSFLPSGFARGADESALLNATFALCVASTQLAQNVRDVTIGFGGRTSLRSQSSGGACDTAPSDT